MTNAIFAWLDVEVKMAGRWRQRLFMPRSGRANRLSFIMVENRLLH
ncbi:hypothetical protein [Sphingobium sp. Z007]|nr:hypothetical protein [Sphingobium sp. Z007]